MRYYGFIKKVHDQQSLICPTEACWMERDDITYFRGRMNYNGLTSWGAPLSLVKGETYQSCNGVAPELTEKGLVEIIPSPYLTDTQKLAPLFDGLPETLAPKELEMIQTGIEAHVYGHRSGNIKGWQNGTEKIMEAIALINERLSRESGDKPRKSFFAGVFS